ncbi:MAG: alpha/beta hydrolase, partial [Pseudomonadota bacterium]|nr:alpha/beta hydrolase [Pseudomonadota bacterium]
IALTGFLSSFSVYAGLTCIPPLCKEKLVQSGDVKIFARDWGALFPNRPTILFAHGFPHSDLIWQDQVNSLLSIKYRIITLDLRGHGASEPKPTTADHYAPAILANDIKSVLNAFNVNKAVLVGHSYGGAPISDFSFYGNNSRIRALVYVDASPALNDQLAGVPADAFTAVALTLPGPSGDPTYG